MIYPSERTVRFRRLVAHCHRQLTREAEFVRVIRDKERYSALLRAAALRNLVAQAPIEVTQGRTYLWRRRAVRLHYGV